MLSNIIFGIVAFVFAASFLFPAVAQVCDELFGGEPGDVRDGRTTL